MRYRTLQTPAIPKGRQKNSVVLSSEEFHVLAVRMGYTDQNLRDDLAMGVIPLAPLLAPPPAAKPRVGDSDPLAEGSRHRSEPRSLSSSGGKSDT